MSEEKQQIADPLVEIEKLEKRSRKVFQWGILGLIAALLFILCLPLLLTKCTWVPIASQPNEIGDTLGGILGPMFAMLAAVLTFLAFWVQYQANIEQRKQFIQTLYQQEKDRKLQQFESQFYEMLRLHKENVNEIEIRVNENALVKGRIAFYYALKELEELFSNVKIYKRERDTTKRMDNIDFRHLPHQFVIAYLVFFHGQLITQNVRIKNNLYRLECYPIYAHRRWRSRLDHYYRHLFLIVNHVHENLQVPKLEDKMKYLEIVRAQLSNDEQLLLFYYWISAYGKEWESKKLCFFTDYKLIYNMSVSSINLQDHIKNSMKYLIDRYNKKYRKQNNATPLFEYLGANFEYN